MKCRRLGRDVSRETPLQQQERELLSRVAGCTGMVLSSEMEERFDHYHALLLKWNSTTNLISRSDESRIVSRHFAESLLLLPYVAQQEKARLLDVGSGAGFPGLPLSICLPHLRVDLLEPRRRASSFLKTVVSHLGLPFVKVVRDRIQDICGATPSPGYDTIVTRALGPPEGLLPGILPLLSESGGFLAFVPDGYAIRPNHLGLQPESVRATIYKVGFPGLTCQRSILSIRTT